MNAINKVTMTEMADRIRNAKTLSVKPAKRHRQMLAQFGAEVLCQCGECEFYKQFKRIQKAQQLVLDGDNEEKPLPIRMVRDCAISRTRERSIKIGANWGKKWVACGRFVLDDK